MCVLSFNFVFSFKTATLHSKPIGSKCFKLKLSSKYKPLLICTYVNANMFNMPLIMDMHL